MNPAVLDKSTGERPTELQKLFRPLSTLLSEQERKVSSEEGKIVSKFLGILLFVHFRRILFLIAPQHCIALFLSYIYVSRGRATIV